MSKMITLEKSVKNLFVTWFEKRNKSKQSLFSYQNYIFLHMFSIACCKLDDKQIIFNLLYISFP